MEELLLELAGGHSAAGIGFAALLQPDLRETDHPAAKQAQGKSRLGVADPAVIFAQSDVQSAMQAALDDPIATFELEKVCRIQLLESEAADEINDSGGFLTLAPDPSAEPGDGLSSGKAHLLRGRFLAIQHSDFVPPPGCSPGSEHECAGWAEGEKRCSVNTGLVGGATIEQFKK